MTRDPLCSKVSAREGLGPWDLLVAYIQHHLEAANLKEHWNGLMKAQLKHQLNDVFYDKTVPSSRV